jgi:hypothetical protein
MRGGLRQGLWILLAIVIGLLALVVGAALLAHPAEAAAPDEDLAQTGCTLQVVKELHLTASDGMTITLSPRVDYSVRLAWSRFFARWYLVDHGGRYVWVAGRFVSSFRCNPIPY